MGRKRRHRNQIPSGGFRASAAPFSAPGSRALTGKIHQRRGRALGSLRPCLSSPAESFRGIRRRLMPHLTVPATDLSIFADAALCQAESRNPVAAQRRAVLLRNREFYPATAKRQMFPVKHPRRSRRALPPQHGPQSRPVAHDERPENRPRLWGASAEPYVENPSR